MILANKYYVLLTTGRVDGPYNFCEATKCSEKWKAYGEYTEILKVVVDLYGKEVK